MKLYGDLMSPFVRMSMVTAIECGLQMRVQLLAMVVKPQEVNPTLAKHSPIGKIPVLERDHAHPLFDSRVIMEYFCHESGNQTLLPSDGSQRFRVLTTLALAQGMADAGVALRYETFARPEAQRWPELADRQRARIAAGLDELERGGTNQLRDLTLASIATACTLGYIDARQLMPDWRKNHSWLSHWQEQFCKRESMAQTVPKA